jgi:hypothetical protein
MLYWSGGEKRIPPLTNPQKKSASGQVPETQMIEQIADTTRTCTRCGRILPLSCFWKKLDGWQAYCKDCHREYRTTDKGREVNVASAKRWRTTPAGKVYQRRQDKRRRTNQPIKVRARDLLNDAVADNKVIPQPCVVCGNPAQGHHEDYNKPFSVIWLCPLHHRQHHEGALGMVLTPVDYTPIDYPPAPREPVIRNGTKRCSRCKQWLPFSQFSKDKEGPAGCKCWCKECDNRRRRERYARLKNKKGGQQ